MAMRPRYRAPDELRFVALRMFDLEMTMKLREGDGP
jgi:hypothetical protein